MDDPWQAYTVQWLSVVPLREAGTQWMFPLELMRLSRRSVSTLLPLRRMTTMPRCRGAGISNLGSASTSASNFCANRTPCTPPLANFTFSHCLQCRDRENKVIVQKFQIEICLKTSVLGSPMLKKFNHYYKFAVFFAGQKTTSSISTKPATNVSTGSVQMHETVF